MMPYAALLATCVLGAWVKAISGINKPGLGYIALFVVYTSFLGLRNEIGPDWSGYLNIYFWSQNYDIGDILMQSEPGFTLLNKVADWTGLGFAAVVFVGSIVFLLGMFSYARITANPWLAISMITPYLVFVVGMSGIRQSMAMGVLFYALSRWAKLNPVGKVGLIAVASIFHFTAILAVLLIVLRVDRWWWIKGPLVIALMAVVLRTQVGTSAFDKYSSAYLEQNVESAGALYHVLLNAFPAALYLSLERKLRQRGLVNNEVKIASWSALLCLPALLLSSTGTDRFSLYLSFVQMWTYPALVEAVAPEHRKELLAGLTLFICAIFVGYFTLGSHAAAYVPYRSILSDATR